MKTEYSLLIVDDEQPVREHVARDIAWNTLGVTRLYEAADGLEALAKVRQYHPDIAILDVKMPKMNGVEFIRKLVEEGQDIQIIALSGYSDFEAARVMLASGIVVEYLMKPASEDTMFEAVYKCIDKIELQERIQLMESGIVKPQTAEEPELVNAEDAAVDAGENGGATRMLTQDVMTYIDRHYAERISLSSAAEEMGVNASYLSRVFSRECGSGFSEYLTGVRIEKACELLKNRRLKIYEICDMVGYQDVKYFIKVFKKQMEMTPTEYREKSFSFRSF